MCGLVQPGLQLVCLPYGQPWGSSSTEVTSLFPGYVGVGSGNDALHRHWSSNHDPVARESARGTSSGAVLCVARDQVTG
jgi:hypothetical protein